MLTCIRPKLRKLGNKHGRCRPKLDKSDQTRANLVEFDQNVTKRWPTSSNLARIRAEMFNSRSKGSTTSGQLVRNRRSPRSARVTFPDARRATFRQLLGTTISPPETALTGPASKTTRCGKFGAPCRWDRVSPKEGQFPQLVRKTALGAPMCVRIGRIGMAVQDGSGYGAPKPSWLPKRPTQDVNVACARRTQGSCVPLELTPPLGCPAGRKPRAPRWLFDRALPDPTPKAHTHTYTHTRREASPCGLCDFGAVDTDPMRRIDSLVPTPEIGTSELKRLAGFRTLWRLKQARPEWGLNRPCFERSRGALRPSLARTRAAVGQARQLMQCRSKLDRVWPDALKVGPASAKAEAMSANCRSQTFGSEFDGCGMRCRLLGGSRRRNDNNSGSCECALPAEVLKDGAKQVPQAIPL